MASRSISHDGVLENGANVYVIFSETISALI